MSEINQLVNTVTAGVQEEVATAVAKRGYRDGWTPGQFLARQVAKLAEELGELAESIYLGGSGEFGELLDEVRDEAKRLFDDKSVWRLAGAKRLFDDKGAWKLAGGRVADADRRMKDELADIQVVVFCVAAVLEEMSQRPYDVVQAAREKATADVGRGVR